MSYAAKSISFVGSPRPGRLERVSLLNVPRRKIEVIADLTMDSRGSERLIMQHREKAPFRAQPPPIQSFSPLTGLRVLIRMGLVFLLSKRMDLCHEVQKKKNVAGTWNCGFLSLGLLFPTRRIRSNSISIGLSIYRELGRRQPICRRPGWRKAVFSILFLPGFSCSCACCRVLPPLHPNPSRPLLRIHPPLLEFPRFPFSPFVPSGVHIPPRKFLSDRSPPYPRSLVRLHGGNCSRKRDENEKVSLLR